MTAKNAKETMKDVSQKAVKATKDAGEKLSLIHIFRPRVCRLLA